VLLFIWGGYVFGNIPLVKHNFGLVTIFVILLSLLPMVVALFRGRTATA
jgi:membrane-associated protein